MIVLILHGVVKTASRKMTSFDWLDVVDTRFESLAPRRPMGQRLEGRGKEHGKGVKAETEWAKGERREVGG